MFGDVPNLSCSPSASTQVARGRPRECMALAQHLVDRGVIAYAGGSWTLPEAARGERPAGARDEVFGARIARCSRARAGWRSCRRSRCSTTSRARTTRRSIRAASGAELDAALDELLAHEVVRSDGVRYRLSHAAVRDALLAQIAPAEAPRCTVRSRSSTCAATGPGIGAVAHLLSAGLLDQGVDLHAAADRGGQRSGGAASSARA